MEWGRLIAEVRRSARRRRGLQGLGWGLGWGAGALLAHAIAQALGLGPEIAPRWLLLGQVFFALTGYLIGFSRPVDLQAALFEMDRKLGLGERLSTIYELRRKPALSPVEAALLPQIERYIRRYPGPGEALRLAPRERQRFRAALVAGLVLLVVSTGLYHREGLLDLWPGLLEQATDPPPSEMLRSSQSGLQPQDPLLQQQSRDRPGPGAVFELVAKSDELLRAARAGQATPEELAEQLEALEAAEEAYRNAGEDASSASTGAQQALQALLERLRDPARQAPSSPQLRQQLEELRQALEGTSAGQALQQALQAQNAQELQQALEQALEQLRQQLEANRRLEQARQALEQALSRMRRESTQIQAQAGSEQEPSEGEGREAEPSQGQDQASASQEAPGSEGRPSASGAGEAEKASEQAGEGSQAPAPAPAPASEPAPGDQDPAQQPLAPSGPEAAGTGIGQEPGGDPLGAPAGAAPGVPEGQQVLDLPSQLRPDAEALRRLSIYGLPLDVPGTGAPATGLQLDLKRVEAFLEGRSMPPELRDVVRRYFLELVRQTNTR